MQVDVLIVGQGICGTMLSWFLWKEGKSFVVIDNNQPDTSSKVAAGIINPVTGRRYIYSWMIDEIMPFAHDTYNEIGAALNLPAIRQKSVIDFFPSAQMRDTFVERLTGNDTYLHTYPDQNYFNGYFNYDYGCGQIRPAYTTNLPALIAGWQQKLEEKNAFRNETFETGQLSVKEDGVVYGNITAERVVFCDGVAASQNPWFRTLPFSASKGEALIIEAPELTDEHIFKRGTLLVPLPQQHLFWVGSSYQWKYENSAPTTGFYEQTTTLLQQWLKVPFTVQDHKAALRPSTLERRPFVGFHPLHPAVGILNGMGTKGASLAPFFAHQLVQHLVHGFPITDKADVHRFSRILSK